MTTRTLYRVRADDGTDVKCDFEGTKKWVAQLTHDRMVVSVEPLKERAETCDLCGQPAKETGMLNDSLQGGMHPGCLRDEVMA